MVLHYIITTAIGDKPILSHIFVVVFCFSIWYMIFLFAEIKERILIMQ